MECASNKLRSRNSKPGGPDAQAHCRGKKPIRRLRLSSSTRSAEQLTKTRQIGLENQHKSIPLNQQHQRHISLRFEKNHLNYFPLRKQDLSFPPRIVCVINSSGNPAFSFWTPAPSTSLRTGFTGVTSLVFVFRNKY